MGRGVSGSTLSCSKNTTAVCFCCSQGHADGACWCFATAGASPSNATALCDEPTYSSPPICARPFPSEGRQGRREGSDASLMCARGSVGVATRGVHHAEPPSRARRGVGGTLRLAAARCRSSRSQATCTEVATGSGVWRHGDHSARRVTGDGLRGPRGQRQSGREREAGLTASGL